MDDLRDRREGGEEDISPSFEFAQVGWMTLYFYFVFTFKRTEEAKLLCKMSLWAQIDHLRGQGPIWTRQQIYKCTSIKCTKYRTVRKLQKHPSWLQSKVQGSSCLVDWFYKCWRKRWVSKPTDGYQLQWNQKKRVNECKIEWNIWDEGVRDVFYISSADQQICVPCAFFLVERASHGSLS